MENQLNIPKLAKTGTSNIPSFRDAIWAIISGQHSADIKIDPITHNTKNLSVTLKKCP